MHTSSDPDLTGFLDGHASVVTQLIQAVPSLLDLPEVQSVCTRVTRMNFQFQLKGIQ
jgi:hypothetical protein